MTGNRQTRRTAWVIFTAIALAAAFRVSASQTISQPPPLKQFLEENGWVPLRVPDRRMGPGSVVKVTQQDGSVTMQWLGDLRRCGITDGEFKFMRGKYRAIGIGRAFAVQAAVAANYIARLGGTVDLEKAGGAVLHIEDSGGDAVDFLALATWLADSGAAQRMPATCNAMLAQDDIYVIGEAFRVSKAVYDLVDRNGAKLAVTGEAFARAGSSSSGTLSVTEDVYFGVRHVRQLAPAILLPSIAPLAVPEADNLLRLMEP